MGALTTVITEKQEHIGKFRIHIGTCVCASTTGGTVDTGLSKVLFGTVTAASQLAYTPVVSWSAGTLTIADVPATTNYWMAMGY
jgi:hypothetical protein